MNTRNTHSANRARIEQFIDAEADTLLRILRLYVVRGQIATNSTAVSVATELLNDVVVEALKQTDRLQPSAKIMAWLLEIASNLIKRRRVAIAKLDRREPLARDLYPGVQHLMSEDEIFDRIAQFSAADPAQDFEVRERIAAMLSGVSKEQERILRLAIVTGLNGEMLAQELGVSAGAARARLHRALNRLRKTNRVQHEVINDDR